MLLSLLVVVAGAATPTSLDAAGSRLAEIRSLRTDTAPTLPASAFETVAAGDVATGLVRMEGHAARKAWGLTVVDHPIDTVWAAVRDFSARTDHGPLAFSQVQKGTHCQSGRTVFQYLPVGVPFVSDRWWVVTLTENAAVEQRTGGTIRELVTDAKGDETLLLTDEARTRAAEGAPIAFSRGGWLAVALDDGRTLVEFHVWTDPGGSIPAGLASTFAEGGVKDNFTSLDAIIAAGPGCR